MTTTTRCVWEQRVMDKRGLGINDGQAELRQFIRLAASIGLAALVGQEVNKVIAETMREELKVGGRT